jgi:thioredoxin 1
VATATGQVLTVTDDTFEAQVLGAHLPVLVEFGAPWCPPCRAAAPILAQLGDELAGKAIIATMDTDAEPHVAGTLGVLALPTFILFKGGAPVVQMVGFQPKAKLLERIGAHLGAGSQHGFAS